MTVSVFDHPLLSGLLGDEEVAGLFTLKAELDAMLRFEAALSEAEAEEGVIPAAADEAVAKALENFHPDTARLHEGTARDGMIVPDLIAQIREAVGVEHGSHVHFGSTSQDVIDTGLALRLARALDIFATRIDRLVAALDRLEKRDGGMQVMAHTRMQVAIPVTAGRKVRSWREPLMRHRARLDAVQAQVAVLHFGGAAGTLDKLGPRGAAVAARLARKLELNLVAHARHSERDTQADYAGWLASVTGSLGKMGQDIALLSQNEIGEIRLATGGGSSAMPHKVNPVRAETLVTLARFNATLVSGVHQALVHENERSGAAWTLEWMLLPQMTVATAAALSTAEALVGEVAFVPSGKGS